MFHAHALKKVDSSSPIYDNQNCLLRCSKLSYGTVSTAGTPQLL